MKSLQLSTFFALTLLCSTPDLYSAARGPIIYNLTDAEIGVGEDLLKHLQSKLDDATQAQKETEKLPTKDEQLEIFSIGDFLIRRAYQDAACAKDHTLDFTASIYLLYGPTIMSLTSELSPEETEEIKQNTISKLINNSQYFGNPEWVKKLQMTHQPPKGLKFLEGDDLLRKRIEAARAMLPN